MAWYLLINKGNIYRKHKMADGPTYQIVNFDANLIGAYYGAKQSAASIRLLPSVPSNVSLSRNNNILTPWDQDLAIEKERFSEGLSTRNLYKLLAKDYAAIQNKNNFIDRKDATVRNSKLDVDSKGLFILYNALKDLKTIADYAGDPSTSIKKLADIEEQFQLGLSQVKEFISAEKFDELTLLFAEKANHISTRAGLGKREYDYIGPIIHHGEKTDPISSLSGTETFSISITRNTSTSTLKSEVTEDFNITIPSAEENRTIETLAIQINVAIQATKTTDKDDEEVPLFKTKFFIEEIEKNKFTLRIKTDFSEKMTFSSNDTEPAIYITGNLHRLVSDVDAMDLYGIYQYKYQPNLPL